VAFLYFLFLFSPPGMGDDLYELNIERLSSTLRLFQCHDRYLKKLLSHRDRIQSHSREKFLKLVSFLVSSCTTALDITTTAPDTPTTPMNPTSPIELMTPTTTPKEKEEAEAEAERKKAKTEEKDDDTDTDADADADVDAVSISLTLLKYIVCSCDLDVLKIVYPRYFLNSIPNKLLMIEFIFIIGNQLDFDCHPINHYHERFFDRSPCTIVKDVIHLMTWNHIQTKLFSTFIELELANQVDLSYLREMKFRTIPFPVSIFQLTIMYTQYNPSLLKWILSETKLHGPSLVEMFAERYNNHQVSTIELVTLHLLDNLKIVQANADSSYILDQIEWLHLFFDTLREKASTFCFEKTNYCNALFHLLQTAISYGERFFQFYVPYKEAVQLITSEIFGLEEDIFSSPCDKKRISSYCNTLFHVILKNQMEKEKVGKTETEMLEWLAFFQIHYGRVRIQFKERNSSSTQDIRLILARAQVIGDSIYIEASTSSDSAGGICIFTEQGTLMK
jgi:hypothetical protein